ncbi:MAG: hypothetical protein Q7J54_00730 [Candidatus Woesearchaeota archaeon]|nr:hypothetical protein [Candidatus Woesearchaeota archaeon]
MPNGNMIPPGMGPVTGMAPPPGMDQKKGKAAPSAPSDMIMQLTGMSSRLRSLEESYINLRKKVQVSDQNMLSSNRKFADEIKAINADILDIKHEIADVKEKMLEVIKELRSSAKDEDVRVLEKYIELWQPLNFVTRNEVKKIVKEILDANLEQSKE